MAETAIQQKSFLSGRVEQFTESVIREMTRQAMQHGAVNLSQGFPDFPAPAEIKRAAQEAIAADVNQYAITWGAKNLRDAIARQMAEWQGIAVDPEREITVCCGSTEAMIVDPAGGVQCRRRGGHLRAVLRELRAGRDSLRRQTALREAASAADGRWRVELRRARTAGGVS